MWRLLATRVVFGGPCDYITLRCDRCC